MFVLQQLDHVALNVSDLERSKAWYGDVLGMTHVYPGQWDGEPIMMALGTTLVALFQGDPAGTAERPPVGIDHFAFRADRANFEAARAALTARGIPLRFADHAVCYSLYLHDPDGHVVEITTYDVDGPDPAGA